MCQINNELYHDLGHAWYEAQDNPIAILRAEAKLTNQWIIDLLDKENISDKSTFKVLDIGCGAGFLTNKLTKLNYDVTGLDISSSSLDVARQYDPTKKVKYVEGDALKLPFEDGTFDFVSAIDFLEHVEQPELVIKEAARVLKPNGFFVFHTFNRNFLSWFVIIKLVEWLVPNTPKNMHILKLFVKPEELISYCKLNQLTVSEMRGTKVNLFTLDNLIGIFKRKVPASLSFSFVKSLKLAYIAFGKKNDYETVDR